MIALFLIVFVCIVATLLLLLYLTWQVLELARVVRFLIHGQET